MCKGCRFLRKDTRKRYHFLRKYIKSVAVVNVLSSYVLFNSANTATAMHRRTRGEKKYPDTKTVIRERNVQRKACITGLMMALIALTVIAIFLLKDILTVR